MSDQMPRPAGQPGPGQPGPYQPGQQGPYPGQPGQPYGYPAAGQGSYPQHPGQGGYGYPAEHAQPMGLAITALVLGVVSFLLATTPVIGIVSFLIGPLAIVFGVLAMRKRQKKALAITGIVLGAVGVVVAAVVTAIVAFLVSQAIGDHTVRYVVTSDQPASVNYFKGTEAVQEQITGNWQKEISYTGLPFGSISVDSTGTATVSCQILMDGSSVSTNSGSGRVDCVSGNLQFWERLSGGQ